MRRSRYTAGAGGDDAEDFARMLRRMYEGYAGKKGWRVRELHSNENDHGGYRNVMLEISGTGAYAYGTRRACIGSCGSRPLMRMRSGRQASALVEVLPTLVATDKVDLLPDDLEIQFARRRRGLAECK